MTRTCPICGTTFDAPTARRVFCSTRCRMRNHRRAVPVAPVVPPEPVRVTPDVRELADRARVAALLMRKVAAVSDSRVTAAALLRVAGAIDAALEAEGWA